MKIALCDDDTGQLHILEAAVRNCSIWHTQDINIDTFTSGAGLLKSVRSGIQYEYIFLDIEMPELSGFDVYSELQPLCDCPVVFVSTHTELLPEALTLKPYGFLVKPYNQDTFDRTIKSIIALTAKNKLYHYLNDGKKEVVDIRRIMYFAVNNYVVSMKIMGDIPVILPRTSLDEVEGELSKFGFFRCNRSVLVNLSHCSGRKGNHLMMRNADIEIEISRRRQKEFDRQLILYKMEAADEF